jgi:phosphoglycerate dehydrogenase-like enzyme
VRILFTESPNFVRGFDLAEQQLRDRRPDIDITRWSFPAPSPIALDGEVLRQADVILASSALPIDRALLSAAKSLRAVVSLGIGTDFIDIDGATDAGVLVAYGLSTENVDSVAEATILFTLSLLYDLKGAEAVCREGLPRSTRREPMMLEGSTIGLLGFGPIAKAVAHRLANWGVRILAHARRVEPFAGVTFVTMDDLLSQSDVVSIHLPLAPETAKLIGREQLGRMKSNAVLINTGRGGIVDEAALAEALAEGRIASAALDVFEVEPPALTHPLLKSSRTLATSHILAQTKQALDAAPRVAVESLLRVGAGEAPRHLRNPEIVPAWTSRWSGAPA